MNTPIFRAILPAVVIDKIKQAMKCVSRDTLRPAMCGVCLDFQGKGKLSVVATDAYRLTVLPLDGYESDSNAQQKYILSPAACKALTEVKRDVNEPIEITVYVTRKEVLPVIRNRRCEWICDVAGFKYEVHNKDVKELTFTSGTTKTDLQDIRITNTSGGNLDVTSTFIDARYPDYQCVIPFDQPYKIEMDRKTLIEHITKNLPAANATTKQVYFEFHASTTENVHVWSQDIERNTYSRTIFPSVSTNMCEVTKICFTGTLLAEMLKNMKCKTVILEMSTATRGVFLTDTNTKDLRMLMPVYTGY